MDSVPYLPEGSDRTESPETATLASFESGDPAASAGPVFLPSEVLADRFRVLRLLGRGGMGEVYEVEDLELGERVAVKTLRSGLAVGERALALFRSEIQLARRVTHPNVCRIFDVFRHQRTAAGEQESVVFLTMELLAGETLSARLRREGPLPLDEALPILRQVAAGLDAAHDAGVTHRDFKSGNVMLVAGDNRPRAVVTDFGLAGAEGVSASRSPVFGTAPYRAPEQERGAAVGPAADLYAFGRVMREVLTGAAVGGERELPPLATQAVEQCLAERPETRPSRATSAVDAIAVALAQESRTPWLGVSLLSLVLLAFGFVAWRASEALISMAAAEEAAALAAMAKAPEQTMVAVVGGEGAQWQAQAVAALLGAELHGTPLAVLDAREFRWLGLGSEGRLGDWRAGLAAFGAELVVDVATGGEPRAEISDLAGGPAAEESAADLAELAARLGERLRRRAGGVRPPPDVRRALVGDDPQAVELYARARAADGEEALALHRQAIARQPEAAVFHFGFARQLLVLAAPRGDENLRQEARVAAHEGRRLVSGLGEELRLLADLELAVADANLPLRLDLLERLSALRPERQEYAVSLIGLSVEGGRIAEAGELIDELAERNPALAGDPEYQHYVALHAYAVGQQEVRLAAASRAAGLYQRFGVRRGELFARLGQHDALRILGRAAEDAEVLDRCEELARAIGPRQVGQVERWRGVSLLTQGESAAARQAFERSLAIARRVDDDDNLGWSANNLAIMHAAEGDFEVAQDLYAEAKAAHQRNGFAIGAIRTESNLGDLLLVRGRLDEADEAVRRVLTTARQQGHVYEEITNLGRLARIALARDDLGGAERLLGEASAAMTEHGFEAPLIHVPQARLALARGEPAEARRLARLAIDGTEDAMPEERVTALRAYAEMEEAAGRRAAARAHLETARRLATASSLVFEAAGVDRDLARLARHRGDHQEAAQRLEAAFAVHRRSGADFEVAHDLLEVAALHYAEGRSTAGEASARQALTIYERLGAWAGVHAGNELLQHSPSHSGLPLGNTVAAVPSPHAGRIGW